MQFIYVVRRKHGSLHWKFYGILIGLDHFSTVLARSSSTHTYSIISHVTALQGKQTKQGWSAVNKCSILFKMRGSLQNPMQQTHERTHFFICQFQSNHFLHQCLPSHGAVTDPSPLVMCCSTPSRAFTTCFYQVMRVQI